MAGELHRAEVMSSKGGRRETPDVALLQSLFADGGANECHGCHTPCSWDREEVSDDSCKGTTVSG